MIAGVDILGVNDHLSGFIIVVGKVVHQVSRLLAPLLLFSHVAKRERGRSTVIDNILINLFILSDSD